MGTPTNSELLLKIKELAKEIDNLPDRFIERLDDRYYKKKEIDLKLDRYVLKSTVAIVSSVLSFFIFILGAIGGVMATIWTTIKTGI